MPRNPPKVSLPLKSATHFISLKVTLLNTCFKVKYLSTQINIGLWQ